MHPHVSEVQQFNQELAALKNMSPVASEPLHRPVEEVNAKWAEMIQAISDREVIIIAQDLKTIERKIVNICLPYSLNICFGCSKKLSH